MGTQELPVEIYCFVPKVNLTLPIGLPNQNICMWHVLATHPSRSDRRNIMLPS